MDAQKKSLVARERDKPENQERRRVFAEQQPALDATRLVFLDESGFRLGTPPHYGWAPVGEKAIGKSVQGTWRTMTMLGAIALGGFRGFMTIDAPTCRDVFLAYVRHQLIPSLRPGDIVVMDNLSAHKSPEALDLIRAAKADVIFLPPYSPELNPIEKVWAKMKELLRRMETLTRDTFDAAVAIAMDAVSTDDIRAWVEHCGYRLAAR